MRFFVVGAAGRTGRVFVTQAAAAGHHVTAFVRDRAKAAGMPAEIVEGDVLAGLPALASDQVIVSALGGGSLGAATANVVAAARVAQRILAVVGAGVLQADEHQLRSELPGYPARFAAIAREHAAVHRALRESSLVWTLVCAPDIADGPASGRCEATSDYLPRGTNRITTGDIAAFWLEEAAAPRFVRTRVGLNTPA